MTLSQEDESAPVDTVPEPEPETESETDGKTDYKTCIMIVNSYA